MERQGCNEAEQQLSQITKVLLSIQFANGLMTVKTRAWGEEYSAIETEKSTWHIIHNSPTESDRLLEHELVVHLQGIMCRHDLPPVQGHIA